MEDIKSTLNIPKTSFEMKANLKIKEPLIQKQWLQQDLYKKILQKNSKGQIWTLMDGPPFANGNIHLGHALNKVLKDIILRYRLMNRYNSLYIPGWDTHGLPIEYAFLKSNPNILKEKTISEFRDACANFATDFINKQRTGFQSLGLICDFKNAYYTYENYYQAQELKVFQKMLEMKLIYKSVKPVYWSPSSQSALADAEIEYANASANSIYVAFNVIDGKKILQKNTKLLIWTTTPWTLPANLAVTVHPLFTYAVINFNNEHFVVLNELLPKIAQKLNWHEYSLIKLIKGQELENIIYKHVLYDKACQVICDNFVSNEDGTGLVQTAPGFGIEDYLACKKYKINIFCPINEYGKYSKEINDKELENLFYEAANPIIIERLRKNNSLLSCETIVHSVAHDWRTKKPIIFRATPQWFVDLSSQKQKILDCLKDVKSIPSWGVERITKMIDSRQEWCISRQRLWGVPIPIIYNENNQPIFDNAVLDNIIELINKFGTNIWFEKPATFFLPKNYDLNKKYFKEKDTLDVWFDSGTSYNALSHFAISKQADLYLEGNDQYRGYFNSSLITCSIVNNFSPYKTIISHGFVLDERGNKMSKSLNNVMDPIKICQDFGCDILRLWIAKADYTDDVRIGKNTLDQISELYRKIRNSVFKFILGNLYDFNETQDLVNNFNLQNQYILNKLFKVASIVEESYKKYNFIQVISALNSFLSELSSWYFEIIKDSLYCDKFDSKERREIQTVLYNILNFFLKALAPIIPHTCEEAYSFLNKNKESLFLQDWYKLDDFKKNTHKQEEITTIFNRFFAIKDEAFKAIEIMRADKIIGKGIDCEVNLVLNEDDKILFNSELGQQINWKTLLNVSVVNLSFASEFKVSVIPCKGTKCVRCLLIYKDINTNNNKENMYYNDYVCSRCYKIIFKK